MGYARRLGYQPAERGDLPGVAERKPQRLAAGHRLEVRSARRQARTHAAGQTVTARPFQVKPLPTILIGVVGGLVVGMTSVGSGSLMIVMLLLLYPMLSSSRLVGTDLIQAIPLVGSAALGHLLFGNFQFDLTTSLLLGSLPGVYLGAKVSSRATDAVIRPALALVLLASGLKLLGLDNGQLGLVVLAVVLLAVPVWGALDAVGQADGAWAPSPVSRRMAVGLQLAATPVGLGVVVALAYFGLVRPALVADGVARTAGRELTAAEPVGSRLSR